MYQKYYKRLTDLVISILFLLVFSPIMILISISLFFLNNGKPFFVQPRPGKNEKIFNLIKFKTMNDRKDESGNLLPDDKRLTVFGKIIRKTSLDEIPQLLNVIKSDMSLVGPRPLLVEYLPLYNKEQKRRHQVKPGITGWAQVNGRNAISWDEKFKFDVWYVDNQSFLLDLKILLLTIKKVFKREGISSTNAATMERFTGSKLIKDKAIKNLL
ncbi:MAG: sugar transferase [Bacteroidota bacterium]